MILKSKKWLTVVFFGVALFFSCYQLTEAPGVWYDEGFYFQTAANLADHGIAGMQFAPDTIEKIPRLTVGYPLIYPLALWFKIFGVDILAGRSLMVIMIMGFLFASYIFAKKLFGPTMAVGTLALLSTLPTIYGNGKSILGEVPGLLYMVVFFLCFNLALSADTRRKFWMIMAGVFAGLCVVTKPIFLVLIPAIAVGLFVVIRRRNLCLSDVVMGVVAGIIPILVWFMVQFGPGATFHSILAYYANPSDVVDITNTMLKNIISLFSDVSTLYLSIVTLIWIAAVWVRVKEKKQIRPEEVIALTFTLLIIAAFTRTAGWYRYLFEAQVVSLIFLPNALVVVIQKISELKVLSRPAIMKIMKLAVPTVITVLVILGAYQTLFHSWVAQAYGTHKTAFWEEYFSALPMSTSVFFYDTPEVALFDKSSNYYQYLQPAGGDIGGKELVAIDKGLPDLIVMKAAAWHKQFPLYISEKDVYKYTILRKIKGT
ncbi:MAG: glycosyltransferase family 39 protein [Candidatus Taylorbacteria bacterium]|nr:glycosyltransferase family 39 protein [Candidatus Taylorbacteria bacterium]